MDIRNFIDILSLVSTIYHYSIAQLIIRLQLFMQHCSAFLLPW